MSNLQVDNIAKADGTLSVGTEYITEGSIKVWANWTGTGTISVNESMNVSSLTDVATGSQEANYTNSMSSANYLVGPTGDRAGSGQGGSATYDSGNTTASKARIRTWDTASVATDWTRVCLSVNGDLA